MPEYIKQQLLNAYKNGEAAVFIEFPLGTTAKEVYDVAVILCSQVIVTDVFHYGERNGIYRLWVSFK